SAKDILKNEVNSLFVLENYELAAEIFIAHKAVSVSKGSRGFVVDNIIDKRKDLARNWNIQSDYIDFSKKVYTETFKEGDVLYQYRIPGTDAGSYYVRNLNITPEQVGISSKHYTEIYKVTIGKDTKSLISTH